MSWLNMGPTRLPSGCGSDGRPNRGRRQADSGRRARRGSQVNGDFGLTRRCDSLGAPNHLGTPDGQDSRLIGRRGPAQGSRSSAAEAFSRRDDEREPWRVVYPLSEVLLLLTCATIASCDDFDEIAAWGNHHLDLLRKFAPYYNGIPCERWLRALVNRIDPETFASCFEDWIRALWPGRHILIAIDGKTSRRTHDKRKGLKALHTLSAYATNAHLTLAQISVPEKTNEITAIPVLLDHLAERKQLEGALVTIDAMGCQVEIAAKSVEHKSDFLLPLKGNQPTLEAEVEAYFETAPAEELVCKTTVEKGHGRIETRVFTASKVVDWIESEKILSGSTTLQRHPYDSSCAQSNRIY